MQTPLFLVLKANLKIFVIGPHPPLGALKTETK